MEVRVTNVPSIDHALMNAMFFSPEDYAFWKIPDVLALNQCYYKAMPHPSIEKGTIGINGVTRKQLGLILGSYITLSANQHIPLVPVLDAVKVRCTLIGPNNFIPEMLTDSLINAIEDALHEHILHPGQVFIFATDSKYTCEIIMLEHARSLVDYGKFIRIHTRLLISQNCTDPFL